ncbi:hypothetical protein FOZ61_007405 [Perkinsus olseni]|uniref:Uncharacterized protein n=1 Tax=Perkinsus olseni TaxID=32597 RepID=A0A7J6M8Q0_PEROL|nr:hypothetical protein FOZ61_007405 [Perkinsus olseni]
MVALAYSAVCMRQDKMAPYLKTCGTKIAKCSSGGAGGPPDLAACADAMKVCESVTLGPLKKKKGTSIYDVRASTGKEGKFFKTNPDRSAVGFLNRRDVQTKLGVTKLGVPQAFVQSNPEVREAFNKFTAYDTTSFVVDLLDGGIEVVVVAGNYDYITNAIGNLNWMTSLKGDLTIPRLCCFHYPPSSLQYPKGGVLGTVRALKYATTGAKIAFINVTDGGHYSDLNNPRGIQRSFFQDFLYGRLW